MGRSLWDIVQQAAAAAAAASGDEVKLSPVATQDVAVAEDPVGSGSLEPEAEPAAEPHLKESHLVATELEPQLFATEGSAAVHHMQRQHLPEQQMQKRQQTLYG